jgi:nuclear transport factor 2 (NTF2) superfamily protein
MTRPPLPAFDHETAVRKVRLAEDAWNTRDAEKVAGALHGRLALAQPGRVRQGARRDRGLPDPKVGNGTWSTG